MKKVINVGIGGRSFILEEDAYHRLKSYLDSFRAKTGMGIETHEVIDELEMRIAEIFTESLQFNREVVNLSIVNKVISQLGMPDGSTDFNSEYSHQDQQPIKKLHRDPDSKILGGVCSGLAIYFNIDVVLIRVLFVMALIMTLGFWVYVILWIVVPLANTAAQKCELRGLPTNIENLRKYSY